MTPTNKFSAVCKTLVVAACFCLASCAGSTYDQAQQNVAAQNANANSLTSAAEQTAPTVIMDPGYYVDTAPIPVVDYPAFLRQKVTIQAERLPFNLLMNQLMNNSPIVVSYDSTVKSRTLISLNYSGPLKGALDRISQQTGYNYTLDGNHIIWSAFETRIFNISFMPGASSYSVGGKFSAIQSAASGGGQTSSTVPDDTQFSSLSGNLSIWQDLQNTLNNLKSPKGDVVISQASTSITVHDHPQNVEAIARYIKSLNRILSQEVSLKVQVIDLTLSKDFDYGVDWNLVNEKLGSMNYSIQGGAGTLSNLANGSAATVAGSTATTDFTLGKVGGSDAVINALSQQGNLSVVTQPTVITLNNQVASIEITTDTSYLASSQTTITNGVASTSLTPGSVQSGFRLYLLPKIQNDHVYLQVTSTISNLDSLTSYNSGSGSTTSTTGGNSVQLPTVSAKQFNIRSEVGSGETLIIAGFKSLKDQTQTASPFGIQPLGGTGAQQKNVQTIVLITPTILQPHSE